jgi:hypothetical protein
MAYKTTKFRELRAHHAFNKSFERLPSSLQKEIVKSEKKLRKLNRR